MLYSNQYFNELGIITIAGDDVIGNNVERKILVCNIQCRCFIWLTFCTTFIYVTYLFTHLHARCRMINTFIFVGFAISEIF